MRVLGVDTGERRTGLAISDPNERIAVPLTLLKARLGGVIAGIVEIAQRETIGRIVVGLPLSLNGGQGPQARYALRVGRAIELASGIPVVYWDERFSTAEADRVMLEAGLTRRRRDVARDATAATIILQDYLDSHRERQSSLTARP